MELKGSMEVECLWVIILCINCGHQITATNMQDTETAFERVLLFYFHF